MSTPVPVVNRLFRVVIHDLVENNDTEVFYSLRGLNSTTIRVKRYGPGGLGHTYELPEPSQGGTLILKRPLLKEKTALTKWCESKLETLDLSKTAAQVFVLNQSKEVVTEWSIEGVYPSGIQTSSLGVDQGNGIVEETITLAYAKLSRVK